MIKTNLEYLTKSLSSLQLSQDDIDVILVKAGLEAEADLDINACDLAMYNRFSIVLKAATHNVSESSYSVSWNVEGVKLFYAALCAELNKENVLKEREPVIQDRSELW